jgi:hypothetical protein
MSAIGRELGMSALDLYTETKNVFIDLTDRPGPPVSGARRVNQSRRRPRVVLNAISAQGCPRRRRGPGRLGPSGRRCRRRSCLERDRTTDASRRV